MSEKVKQSLTAIACTTHTVDMTYNVDLTMFCWPHPDLHAEILDDAGADINDPVAVEATLREYANDTARAIALGLASWEHVSETGVVTIYTNVALRAKKQITNPRATHYARPIVGGEASDPDVKRAREFMNEGMPDGSALWLGSAVATKYGYAKAKAPKAKSAKKRKTIKK